MSDSLVPSAPGVSGPGRFDARRITLATVMAFAVIAVAGVTYAKWWPYAHKVSTVLATHSYPGKSPLSAAGAPGTAPSWHDAWHFATSYGLSVWVALAAAVLIGAGVEVLLPRSGLRRVFGAPDTPGRSSLRGGLLAVPCLMCTCCAAPITISLRRSQVPLSGALSYWLGNPVLNPVVVIFLAVVLPWQYAVVRVVIGALVVFAAAPLVVRLVARRGTPVPAGPLLQAPEVAGATPSVTVGQYLKAVARLGAIILPEYFVVVLALGAFRGWLLPLGHGAATWGFDAALIAAAAGTLLVIPTAGEVPIILALVVTGFPAVVTGALLIALPAVSLPSMVMVGRFLSWRVVAATAGTVMVSALAAGALVAAL